MKAARFKIEPQPYSPFTHKHVNWLKATSNNWLNVLEGGKRGGKNVISAIAFGMCIDNHDDPIHLVSGFSLSTAGINVLESNGFGLLRYFDGRCREGKYKNKDALFVNTPKGEKVIVLSGGGVNGDDKRIQGNSYGCALITEVNKCTLDFIKEVDARTLASSDRKIFHDFNPLSNNHYYYKEYLNFHMEQQTNDSNYGVNYCHSTILDNLSLSQKQLNNVLKTYDRTSLFWFRDILGQRKDAEGLVFPTFADSLIKDNSNYGIYFMQQPKTYRLIHLGLDLGETKSKTILTASGLYYDNGYKVDTLEAIDLNTIDLDVIAKNILDFCDTIQNKYGVRPIQVWSDNNLGMVRNIGNNLRSLGSGLYIDPVDKSTISLQDYIKIITTLLNNNKLKIGAKLTQNSLSTLLYDDKKNDDSILDNGTCDVDSYDSFRYSIVAFIKDYNLT